MKRIITTSLCILFLTQIGCTPADIRTRQEVSANSSADLAFVSVPNSVKRGEMASITVKGEPGEFCSIAVHLSGGVSKAKGLEPAETDENGFITWSWKISKQTKPGQVQITVVCGGKTANTTFIIEP